MHLALFLTLSGLHLGGWRHTSSSHADPMDIRAYASLARKAEQAALDMIFVADKLAIDSTYGGSIEATVSSRAVGSPEPLTLLSALSILTDRIGLAATISTTYTEPYHVARMLGSINHYSRGRLGWNAVTSVSDGEARNFGRKATWSTQNVMTVPQNSSMWYSHSGEAGNPMLLCGIGSWAFMH